jgi:LPS-assembly protein
MSVKTKAFAAKYFISICIWMLGLMLSTRASAASSTLKIPGGGQLIINADQAFRDYDRGTFDLRGNVQLIYNQQYMSCDHAIIDEKTHMVQAEGNLVISSPQAYVEGSRALLNYTDNTGVIENGFVKSGQVVFEGKTVRKTGHDTYEAENSYYTACTTCPTAWGFSGSRMRAEIGGYAYIKNPIMEIANVPVLWFPYLIIPLKSERQSGLLIPTLEIGGDDGVVLGLKYFWAISRSQDATLSVLNYSRRGIKGIGNYRYVLSNDSAGELNFGIIHDQFFSANTPLVGRNANRWFVNYDQSYQLPYDFSQKTKLNLVSDLWYPRDFWREISGRGDPALENRASLTRNTEATHSSLDIGYYVNMLNVVNNNPVSSNKDTVHRWPELRYSLIERPVTSGALKHLQFGFDINYVNFARDGAGYDDVIPSGAVGGKSIDETRSQSGTVGRSYTGGVFDPAFDLVRTGQRLDVRPEISYPFQLGPYLDVLPSIQFRHTQYAFNVPSPSEPYDTTPSRNYLRGGIAARTRFYRIYGRTEDTPLRVPTKPVTSSWIDNESRTEPSNELVPPIKPRDYPTVYRHEIVPEVSAASVPYIQQPANHPFFAQGAQLPIFLEEEPISNTNFTNDPGSIQFDYNDRITRRNMVSTVLTNKLVRKRWLNGTPEYKQIASFRLGQSYDIDEARREAPPSLPYSDISAALDIHLDRFDASSAVRYFPYHRVTTSVSGLRFKNEQDTNYVGVSYAQSYLITHTISQTENSSQAENVALTAGFITRHLDLAGSLNYLPTHFSLLDMQLTSFATDLKIKPPGNCWGIKVHYEQIPAGPRAIQFDFDYNFGGATG